MIRELLFTVIESSFAFHKINLVDYADYLSAEEISECIDAMEEAVRKLEGNDNFRDDLAPLTGFKKCVRWFFEKQKLPKANRRNYSLYLERDHGYDRLFLLSAKAILLENRGVK